MVLLMAATIQVTPITFLANRSLVTPSLYSLTFPALAFFVDFLTLEDWTNTLSLNLGNKLSTMATQHSRKTKTSSQTFF